MGDLIRAIHMNPCDAMARADIVGEGPAIEEQDRSPTPNELAEIEKLAEDAARIQDELRAIKDDRPTKLKKLKAELLGRMLKHGMRELKIYGRPAIEVSSSRSTKPTRKSIIETLQRMHGDEKKGRKEAIKIWNAIEVTVSNSLKIPEPSPPEVEAPY